jgi:hypothetical protein
MKNQYRIFFLFILAGLITCKNPAESVNDSGWPVVLSIKAKQLENPIYRLTISGYDMDTIGPAYYSSGQVIQLYVPVGSQRLFIITV